MPTDEEGRNKRNSITSTDSETTPPSSPISGLEEEQEEEQDEDYWKDEIYLAQENWISEICKLIKEINKKKEANKIMKLQEKIPGILVHLINEKFVKQKNETDISIVTEKEKEFDLFLEKLNL